MPKPCQVPHEGQLLTLRELAAATGIQPETIFKRWSKGDRGERLIRPLDARGIRNPLARKETPWSEISSLLAGWKSVTGASDLQTVSGRSAEST
jgi:hypothetical protein